MPTGFVQCTVTPSSDNSRATRRVSRRSCQRSRFSAFFGCTRKRSLMWKSEYWSMMSVRSRSFRPISSEAKRFPASSPSNDITWA